jgi:diadenosine tetraphosphate (Ap4A) HIT family hydrolase
VSSPRRRRLDEEAYLRRSRAACFVCELVRGNPDYAHHVVFEDDRTIAFLSAYPTLYGTVLVAPRDHREEVTGDFSEEEYVDLQRVVHRVGEALRRVVPTERLYVLSLGSREANRHVHWHVAPLPPGVPFDEQQLEALSPRRGVLEVGDEELAELAKRIRSELA